MHCLGAGNADTPRYVARRVRMCSWVPEIRTTHFKVFAWDTAFFSSRFHEAKESKQERKKERGSMMTAHGCVLDCVLLSYACSISGRRVLRGDVEAYDTTMNALVRAS